MKSPRLRPLPLIACWLGSALGLHAATLDLETATILDLQKAYAAGVPSEKIVEIYLKRIAAYDQAGPKLNSILFLNPNALAEARALDAERKAQGPRSLLHGVPVVLKDNFDTFDMPTTGGSKALKDSKPLYDAFTVKKLRAAGAIFIAKTNLDEFARGATGTSSLGGQTLNPYNLEKIPGGSSAGTGAAVAALFAQIGTGTETGSSIRNPSTKNNLVGFSPSEGLVSRQGIIPISITYDRGGPMARSVTDAAIMMSVMAGTDAADLFTLNSLGRVPADNYLGALKKDGLKGARIGVLRDLMGSEEADQPALALVDAAIKVLKDQGATVLDPMPTGANLWQMARETTTGTGEYRQAIDSYFAARGTATPVRNLTELIASGGYLGRLKKMYEDSNAVGEMTTNPDYIGKIKARWLLRAHVAEVMKHWQLDAVVFPHETKPARTIADAVPNKGATAVAGGEAANNRVPGTGNRLSTATGLPTIVVPIGFNSDGVSVGLEFLGQLYDEATVIRLAYAFEQAAPNRKLPTTTPLLGIEKITYGETTVAAK
ncbi:MAG: amidase family protein [Opitutaceae bacterium]|nr:amidase family protein [Opitutaceae bacterium]